MQVPEKWLTLLDHVSTSVPWQRLSGDSGFRRWVPWLRCIIRRPISQPARMPTAKKAVRLSNQ